jgi:hypothetical protein
MLFPKYQEKKARKEYEAKLAQWQAHHDSLADAIEFAQTFNGESSDEILLKAGESLFAQGQGFSLVEERRGAGQWQGRSSGVSIPIGSIGGRSVRYRVGQTKGHYVQGAPTPTAIDVGTVFVTNQRVVFQGSRQTRECLFSKLIGVKHTTDGSTIFTVSNRQRPTVIHYGVEAAEAFDNRLALALAHYRSEVPALVGQLQKEMADVDAAKPSPPALADRSAS